MNNVQNHKRISLTTNQYFSLISLLNLIAIIITLIFLIYLAYNSNSFKGMNINEYSNNYCRNISNEYYDFLCTNKYYRYNYKKNKFIWIITDGTAYDQLNILNNFEKYKIASPILINGDDITYKHTNEMHETLITGKHNRNFNGNEIEGDNLFKQLINAGYKINFRGWEMPCADLVGDKKKGKNENKIFNKKFIDNKHEVLAFSTFCNITNPFPFISSKFLDYQKPEPNHILDYEVVRKIESLIDDKKEFIFDNLSKTELYDELDIIFSQSNINIFSMDMNECLRKSFEWNDQENISILYYTTEVDQYNHFYGKAHIYTILQMYITEKMIEELMKWIDIHDEYALIITSDHGGQNFLGEDIIRNHGIDFHGNEAILFIYTKELKEHYNELNIAKRYIHMKDVNEILNQVLLNISIPLNSKGFPINLVNDSVNIFSSLKSKEIQLINIVEYYSKKYPYYENDLKDLLIGLKDDFSQINYILSEYITAKNDNQEDYITKHEEFQILINKNKKFLFNVQSQLQKILYLKDISISNRILMFFISIFLLGKIILEYRMLIFKFVQHNNYYRNFLLINAYLALIIFSPIIIWIKTAYINNLRNAILLYALYLILGFVIIILFNNFFRNRNIYPNNQKIWILIISIVVYALFCKILSYSLFNFNIKKYFITCSRIERISINLFTFYFFMFCYIFKEIGKFRKKYILFFTKKIYIPPFVIYFLLLITVFFEDCTRKNYYDQTPTNKILVLLNICSFGLILIISKNYYSKFEEKLKEKEVTIGDSTNSHNKDNSIIIQSNNNYGNIIVNNHNNNSPHDLVENEEKIKKPKYKKIGKYPFMKIYLLLIFFWLSEESEKFIGIIFIIFLDVLDYLSNHFYSQIKEILRKESEIKNYNEQNLLIHYYIYYIIIQDMYFISNEITFALSFHSFGFGTDKLQGAKGASISKFLSILFSNISKYKLNFIVLAFFSVKEKHNKRRDNNKFAMDFMARKIILGLRLGIYFYYLFSQILIYLKDELFSDLFVYGILNISLYLLDYLFSGIAFVFR